MSNILEYKGYHGKVEYSVEDQVLFGTILGINDLITFESDNAEEIEENFKEAVDDYLYLCEKYGKEPQKEYSGCLNVRIPKEMHKKLAIKASEAGVTLNKLINQLLEDGLKLETSGTSISTITNKQSDSDGYKYDFQDNIVNYDSLKYSPKYNLNEDYPKEM